MEPPDASGAEPRCPRESHARWPDETHRTSLVVVLGPAVVFLVAASTVRGEIEPHASGSFEREHGVILLVNVNSIVSYA